MSEDVKNPPEGVNDSPFEQHFTIKKLLKFVYPSIIMMVFTSVYGVVDGIFVSNFAGVEAFGAINLIIPVIMAFGSVGFMLGTGGSALVSKLMGEGQTKRASAVFSLITYTTVILGIILTIVGVFTIRPLAILLKADKEGVLEECVLYGTVNISGITLFMLQNLFQSFFPVAGKHKLGLLFVVAAGLTNAALDGVLVAGCNLGILGAALATVIGQAVGGLGPVFYFVFKRKGLLALGKPELKIKPILKSCLNGSSEMMTNLSLSIVNIMYNLQLVALAPNVGVKAYGVLMYVGFIFCSVFIGYSIGVAPVVGYNFGAKKNDELKSVLKKSLIIIAVASVIMFTLCISLHYPLAYIFVGKDTETFDLTRRAFLIISPMFLVMGFNIFGSAFFTALNNGLVSAVISFLRTLAFQVLCVMVLPLIWGLDGIWSANVFAEILSIAVTVTFILTMRKRYGY